MRILLLLFFSILQIGITKGANVVEQYNLLLTSEQILGGRDKNSALWDVRESRNGHDNFALICIEGTSVLISSSIINNRLYKVLQDKDISSDQPAISVMDLLYLYNNPTQDNSLINGCLFEKVDLARRNPNREIIIQMLKLVVSNFITHRSKNPGGIFYRVQNKYFNIGELEKIEFTHEAVSDEKVLPLIRLINFVSEGITDVYNKIFSPSESPFLSMISSGIEETSVVYSFNLWRKSIIATLFEFRSSHQETDKQILLREINQQLKEISSEENMTSLSLAKSIVNLVRLIRGPNLRIGDIWRCGFDDQYPEHHNPNQYVSAITHTEQMVDWLSKYFDDNILVKISGKAPCVKCSHYIQYAQGIMPNWNARTILGYTVGWSGRNPMLECMQYRYPIKVFNAQRVNTDVNPWTLIPDDAKAILVRKLIEFPGTYDESDFGANTGTDLSYCYAIENIDRVQSNEESTKYKGPLTIQTDGSIIQTKPDRSDDQLLIPYNSLSHAEIL